MQTKFSEDVVPLSDLKVNPGKIVNRTKDSRHCRKGDMECKYWIEIDNFDIQQAYSYGMSPRDKKQIRKIIFEHFDYIVEQWQEFQERRQT